MEVDHPDGAVVSFSERFHDQIPDASRLPANERTDSSRSCKAQSLPADRHTATSRRCRSEDVVR
jgi:hypothetical protein